MLDEKSQPPDQDREDFDTIFYYLTNPDLWVGVVSLATWLLGSEDDAEDIVQEVYLRIWSRRPALENRAAARGYLAISVRNSCFNSLRDKKQYRRNMEAYARQKLTESEAEAVDYLTLLRSLGLDEEDLHQMVEQLAPGQRKAIDQHYLQGKSHKQIAEERGSTEGLVRKSKADGLTALRKLLPPALQKFIKKNKHDR